MAESGYDFEQFFDREGFNKSLSHFQAVSTNVPSYLAQISSTASITISIGTIISRNSSALRNCT